MLRPDAPAGRDRGVRQGWIDTRGRGSRLRPARLTQARRLAGLTKKAVAREMDVSAVAVGQWESGTHPPRPDHVGRLAEVLEVPPASLPEVGRTPTSKALPRTSAVCGDASAPAGQGHRLRRAGLGAGVRSGKRVQLPPVDLPGFTAGEVAPEPQAADPVHAARALRQAWGFGTTPIPHMVRLMRPTDSSSP